MTSVEMVILDVRRRFVGLLSPSHAAVGQAWTPGNIPDQALQAKGEASSRREAGDGKGHTTTAEAPSLWAFLMRQDNPNMSASLEMLLSSSF